MEQRAPEDDDQKQRVNLVVLVFVIVLVVLGAWLLVAFKHSSDLLDCIAAHHRNCGPTI